MAKPIVAQTGHEICTTDSLKTGSDEKEVQSSKTSDTAFHAERIERDINMTQQAYASLIVVSELICAVQSVMLTICLDGIERSRKSTQRKPYSTV